MSDRGLVMGGRHHKRRRQDPPSQEFLQHQSSELLARLSQLVPSHVDQVAVAATKLEVRTQPSVTHNLLDISAQSCTDPVQLLSDSFLLIGVSSRYIPRPQAGHGVPSASTAIAAPRCS
jgi:hypothetical protein